MAAEPGNRFQHLLQPIRDLSKIWNIEIADELEKYIAEVASLSFHGDGSRKLNFAEAALLIQGSTAIYSRKVEQLYALVYQALGQICAEKEKSTDGQARRKVPNGLWALVPETDELLTIGHLIKEGRNVTVDEGTLQRQEQRQALHRRVPLFLMPREKTGGKQEFRISQCTLHRSGAYLIEESDARLLEELLSREGHVQCSPLAPPPPGEVRALDEQLQELLRGLPASETASGLAPSPIPPAADAQFEFEAFEAPGTPGCGMVPEAHDCDGSPLQSLLRGPQCADADAISSDPWALLDEDAQVGHDTPLEASSCTKRWGTKGLLAMGEGLPTAGTRELSDSELWRPGHAAEGLPGFMAAGHPVESLFLVVGTHLRNGGRTETERAGFSAAWLEFEDLFQAASTKRKKMQAQDAQKKAKLGGGMDEPAPFTPHMAGQGGADSDDEFHAFTPPRGIPTEATQITPLKSDMAPVDEELSAHRQQVAKLEGLIEDAQSQYESSVRGKLQVMQGSVDVNGQKYPELYENVRRWQEQLGPVLKEFESHPEFDINNYGSKLIGKMVAVEKTAEGEDQPGQAIPFSRLVYGQPRWEVCRRFLTCLILTNQGNTDIVCEAEDDRVNKFGLKLLKAEQNHLSLYSDEEPEAMPIAAGTRGKDQRGPSQGVVEDAVAEMPTPLRRRAAKRTREEPA